MALSDIQKEFCLDVARLIEFIFETGCACTFGEAYRTKEQAEIYAKQGIGIKNSLHCERLAIDLNLFSPEGEYLTKTDDYQIFGNYWESLNDNNKWGGRFNDGNHFERRR